MSAKNTIELDDALKRLIERLAATSGTSPAEVLREAVDEYAARRNGGETVSDSDGIWDIVQQVRAGIPDEEWDQLPSDLSKNFDHYHYGHPRED